MNIRRLFKNSVAALSTIMFIYQTSVTVIKLTDPPVVDSTTTLNIADIDLLVTICPLGQWNVFKLNELGYKLPGSLMLGFDITEKFVGWGAQQNLTFDNLILKTQNYNLTNPQINMMNTVFTPIELAYEKNFYPKFGWCYDLTDLSNSGEKILGVEMGSDDNIVSQYRVFITDKSLRTRNTLHAKSHWGSSIDIHKFEWSKYVIKVEQLSYFDPRNPDNCKTFAYEEFDKCVDEEVKKVWKPLINCNPPWLTSEDQCNRMFNITTDNGNEIYEKTLKTQFGIYQMKTFPAKEKCFNPCTVAQSMVLVSGRDKDQYNSLVTLDFEEQVVYTTKKLAYGPSEFLIDLGSSLGLWFGLSVFGIMDLGIVALEWVDVMQREVKKKYMK